MNNNNNFYIPTLQELDSYNDSNQEINMPSNNQSCNNNNDNNNICNSEIVNNNLPVDCGNITNNLIPNESDELQYFLDNSCGIYTILFPLDIHNLSTPIASSLTFKKSTLTIHIEQSVVIEYHKVLASSPPVLTCNSNHRTFKISSENCALEIEIKGNILYDIGTPTNSDNTNSYQYKSLVFNGCLELVPYKSPDPCNPSMYQKFISSVDNMGTLLINYTYANKTFNIIEIIVDIGVIFARPFF